MAKVKRNFKQAMNEVDKLIKGSDKIPLSGDPKKEGAETRLYEAANRAKKEGIK